MGKQLNVENSVISAKDDALFYNAMIQKNGVWQYGNKLNHEIISANQINIKDGMVTAQGRNYVIYPNEVDSMTIENGTVNTKRNDLIVYEVSKTSEGEQVGLKVIKGTNAATPTDPTLTQDDTLASGSKYQMPLYRVRLNGINVEGVDDLREYIVSFGKLSNPNLFINGDFRVWQRGKTISNVDGAKYTADRWQWNNSVSGGIIVAKVDGIDGMYVECKSACYCELTYKIEDKSALLNKDLTLSFYSTKEGVGEQFGTVRLTSENDYIAITNAGVVVETGTNPNLLFMWGVNLTAGEKFNITNIKLEPGSIATPLVPRHYGEELALCQRYYIPIFNYQGSYPFRGDDKYISIFLPRIMMRTNPTVTGGKIAFAGITIDGYVVSLQEASTVIGAYERDHGVEIAFAQATNVVNFGTAYIVTTMKLDAEIY